MSNENKIQNFKKARSNRKLVEKLILEEDQARAKVLAILKSSFGENSTVAKQEMYAFEGMLHQNASSPNEVMLSFVTSLSKRAAKLKKSRTPLKFDPKKIKFTGYATGVKSISSCDRFVAATIKMSLENKVHAFIDGVFKEGFSDPTASETYTVFVERLRNMDAGEDPFVITETLLFHLRQFDPINWRLSGDTLRTMNKRNKRVERGEISGEVRATNKDTKSTVEEDFDYDVSAYAVGRDVFFPLEIQDAELDRFMAVKDVEMEIENRIEGKPAIQLHAGDNGAFAFYTLESDTWSREHVERTGGAKPLDQGMAKVLKYFQDNSNIGSSGVSQSIGVLKAD